MAQVLQAQSERCFAVACNSCVCYKVALLTVCMRHVCIFCSRERGCWCWKLHFIKLGGNIQVGESQPISLRKQGVEDVCENWNNFFDLVEMRNLLYFSLFQVLYYNLDEHSTNP
jgi:hypothetical protein